MTPTLPYGDQNNINKLRFLGLLRRLRLITPVTYAKTLCDHIDPMSQIAYEAERLMGPSMRDLERAMLGANLQRLQVKMCKACNDTRKDPAEKREARHLVETMRMVIYIFSAYRRRFPKASS